MREEEDKRSVRELLLGIALGLGAGLSPGPLLGLVLTSTLKRGLGAGVRIALAPLLTDAPIVLLSVFVLESLPAAAVRALGVVGGAYVIYLGTQALRGARTAELSAARNASSRRDILRGALVNALSPHPWLFWLSAGGPLLVNAWGDAPVRGVTFLVGFYGLLVGTKILVAGAVTAGRQRMSERWYQRALLAAGVLLSVAGVLLIWEFLGVR
jgi:threonine/homoserine/homoserine lactone efflux protein